MSFSWTDDELSLFGDGHSDEVIAERTGRTVGAVQRKRRKLKGTWAPRATNWSDAELAILADNLDAPFARLHELLPHRTGRSISAQRRVMRERLNVARRPHRAKPICQEDLARDRPLWVPFVTASGVKAIRTEAGVVPFVSLLHSGHDASSLSSL